MTDERAPQGDPPRDPPRELPRELQELSGDYVLERELGRGGTAVVYLARDRELGRRVAIKVIRAKYVTDDEVTARLAREARVLAHFQHPNIVAIYGVRRLAESSLALIMQHVPGRTLKEAVRQGGALPFAQAASVLADVAQALAYAHRHGVVHRDVKPENVFLEEGTGRALLSDFGSATAREMDVGLTGTGIVVGTPAYMSPEQIDGSPLDGRSDIYSLGLLGWEVLTGLQPWGGDSLLNVLYLQRHRDLPAVDDLRPDTPKSIVSAIEGALEKDVAARWPTAEAFLAELSSSARRPRRRRSVARGAAASGALLPAHAGADTMRFERPSSPAAPDEHPNAGAPARDGGAAVVSGAIGLPPDIVERLRERPAPRRRRWAMAALALVLAGAAGGYQMLGRPYSLLQRGGEVARVTDAAPRSEIPLARPGGDSLATGLATSPPALAATPLVDSALPASTDSTSPDSVTPDSAVRDSSPPARPGALAEGSADRPEVRTAEPRAAAAGTPLPATAASVARAPARIPTPALPPTSIPIPVPGARSPTAAPPAQETEVSASGASGTSTGALETRTLAISLGGLHSCALGVDSRLYCWGSNDRGQLGAGRTDPRLGPTPVAGSTTFESVAAGTAHTCALSRDRLAWCWGGNDRGQVGDGSTVARITPVRVFGGHRYSQIRASIAHTCALDTDGSAWCWGRNANGQLGDASTNDRLIPVLVTGGHRFRTLATGWHHTCAVDAQGQAWCWGSNVDGQLGDSSASSHIVPVAVRTEARFTQIAAGAAHTCGLTAGGTAYCWGRNAAGQLGDGTVASTPVPTRVQEDGRMVSLVAGSVHSCALLVNGNASCWGRNNYGQLGDGTTADRALPVAVAAPTAFIRLDASGAHTCGTTRAGVSYCWGYNVDGQLGDGTRVNRPRPTRVGGTPE